MVIWGNAKISCAGLFLIHVLVLVGLILQLTIFRNNCLCTIGIMGIPVAAVLIPIYLSNRARD